ncbi:P-type conjugative transfer protein TrbL [Bradyrhizobium sp. MOS001]|uniref:P-type conjugative transfer protein TrbL n=1 Tax=Bradyrhizobium sp. MOS001 TaxID=2133948 RepID=UPI0010756D90|nr:P-type conjugative transfer protein TrbL [Bradyrhizobium sp. MOS001]TFW54417.1 P-type conjugative transfer protein TrbL [Bradyrhizobium sp. MOS001]
MADLSVIDRFTETFSRYIDSGFGLLSGDVSFLSSTLIGIDVTLAGLAWSLKADDHIMVTLAKKVLYVGAFAFIIGSFKNIADIVFASFSSIGLKASGGALTAADLARPGFVAAAGFTAAHPLLEETGQFSGFDVLTNLPTILILLFCWILIVLAFFVLSVQLFVTLIEFKLTTLASFILVPFALWGKTAFLAEKTLGNVVASGVKVMVLAIIIGIGSTIFGQLSDTLTRPIDIASAMSLLLAALSLFGLGIFGPGIAAGLVSGAPQLGAGAAAGTAAGAAAVVIGGGAVAMGGLRAAASGAGGSVAAVRSAASLSRAATASGTSAQTLAAGQIPGAGSGGATGGGVSSGSARSPATPSRGQAREAAQVAAHTLKEGDRGAHSSGPKLEEE